MQQLQHALTHYREQTERLECQKQLLIKQVSLSGPSAVACLYNPLMFDATYSSHLAYGQACNMCYLVLSI